MHVSVYGYHCRPSGRYGVDNEFLACVHISADEDIRFRCLQCHRISDNESSAAQLHLCALKQLSPVWLLPDAVKHHAAFSLFGNSIIKLRIESSFRVLYRYASAESDAGTSAVLFNYLSLSPSGVDAYAFSLAFAPVFESHRHVVV